MGQTIDINFTDYSPEVLKAMEKQVRLGLSAIGQKAEGYAKGEAPVDTGRLRNSISNAVETQNEHSVYVGTNVEYAPKQEFIEMKHKTGKAHFLRDSISTHTEEYKEILESALKND